MAISLAGVAAAQQSSNEEPLRPFKFQIRHADPWFVKALIEGMPVPAPELSTVPGFAGLLNRAAGTTMSLLKDGFLVVNPTDNSLWYYPKPRGL